MPSYGKLIRDYGRRPEGVYDQVRCIYNCVPGSIAIRTKEGLYHCLNCHRRWQRGFNTYRILRNMGL